jgi:hypothetical protein
MRSSRVVRASDCQCQSCNSPGFDISISETVESEGGRGNILLEYMCSARNEFRYSEPAVLKGTYR